MKFKQILTFTTISICVSTANAGFLKSLCEIYLGTPKSEIEKSIDQAEDLFWSQRSQELKANILEQRSIGPWATHSASDELSAEVTDLLKLIVGQNADVGFHYNLNGGQAHEYLERGGIKASLGDIAANSSMNIGRGTYNPLVYFFRLSESSPKQILDTKNLKNAFLRTRMGSTLIIFNTHHPKILSMANSGFISETESIYFEFDPELRSQGDYLGVPKQAFLSSPIRIFQNYKKYVGFKLTWDEQTYISLFLIKERLKANLFQASK